MLAAGEGAELAAMPVSGIVRAASVMLERSGRVSVFNEPGPTVEEIDWTRLLGEVERRAPGHQTVVCSGSLPPGSPVDGYARVVLAARGPACAASWTRPARFWQAALTAHPDVVSPNLAEAETLRSVAAIEGVEPVGEMVVQRAVEAAQALVALAPGMPWSVPVATAPRSAMAAKRCSAGAPRVSVVSPIGAGDSLVGGLVDALEHGQQFKDAVRFALAVASASCEQPVAGAVDVSRARELAASLPAAAAAPEPSPDSGSSTR